MNIKYQGSKKVPKRRHPKRQLHLVCTKNEGFARIYRFFDMHESRIKKAIKLHLFIPVDFQNKRYSQHWEKISMDNEPRRTDSYWPQSSRSSITIDDRNYATSDTKDQRNTKKKQLSRFADDKKRKE